MTRTSSRSWWYAAAVLFVSGWGANQFTPLLIVYRQQGLSVLSVDAVFGAYVLGLAPGLLILGPSADRSGRRRVSLRVTALAVVASGVLALGALMPAALYLGRFISGVAAGAALAAATAWLKDLSSPPHAGAAPGASARRAALATTSGFIAGASVAGLLAQYAPWPTVLPYGVHALLASGVLLALPHAPETRAPPARSTTPPTRPRNLARVASNAPWVFATAAVAYVVLPGVVATRLSHGAVGYTAMLTTLTLAVGAAVQPLCRRMHRAGSPRTAVLALVASALGLALAALTAELRSLTMLLPTVVLLGSGYGLGLVAGLLEVQALTGPDRLAAATGRYYALSYVGFLLPVAMAALSACVSYPAMLLTLAAMAMTAAAITAVAGALP